MEALNSTQSSSRAKPAQGKLLVDWRPVKLQLVESGENGKVIVRGEFAKANSATENRRIYPEQLWEREIRRLSSAMKDRQVYGELDHPSDGRTQLKRASHLLTNLELKDGLIIGEAEIMETSAGRELRAIINAGGKVGISSRGYGSVRTNEHGQDIVQNDYRLGTFDFVADPADQDAFPDVFFESRENLMADEENLAKEFAREIEKAKQVGHESAEASLREEFSREIVNRIAEARAQISEQVRGELLSDPTVAGARTALDKIKDVLRPFILPEDAQAVAAQKDGEIQRLKNQIAEHDLKIKDLEEDNTKLAHVAKEAGYKYYLERQIANDPDADIIRNLIGDVTRYENANELKVKVEAVKSDMAVKSQTEQRLSEQLQRESEEEVARKEKERSRVIKHERVLREENEKLREALDKSLMANKELGLRVYTESRLSNHPKASKIRSLIESANIGSREDVDSIVSQFREPVRDSDDLEAVRARVRKATSGGYGPTPMEEEDQSPRRRNSSMYNELGVPLQELKRLSGFEK